MCVSLFISFSRVVWHWHMIPLRCRTGKLSLFVCLFVLSEVQIVTRCLQSVPPTLMCVKPWRCWSPDFMHSSHTLHSYHPTISTKAQTQDAQIINAQTVSLAPLFLPSFSHLIDADGAFIYAPMHTSCQTCRFWLQMLQCRCKTFVSQSCLRCSQAECRELGVCLFQREIGDWSCLLGMLLVMRSLEMPPSSSAFSPLVLLVSSHLTLV